MARNYHLTGLEPASVWKNFYAISQIPRETGNPEGITSYLLDFCKAKGFTPKSSYYNRCHLCQDMRLFLYRNFPGAFPELAPASFYEAVIAEN